jgi:hypothetical protein
LFNPTRARFHTLTERLGHAPPATLAQQPVDGIGRGLWSRDARWSRRGATLGPSLVNRAEMPRTPSARPDAEATAAFATHESDHARGVPKALESGGRKSGIAPKRRAELGP